MYGHKDILHKYTVRVDYKYVLYIIRVYLSDLLRRLKFFLQQD